MIALRAGVVRYASVGAAVGRELGLRAPPDFRIDHGRMTVTFRSTGASHWSEEQQVDHALYVASVVRNVIASDSRRAVRRRMNRAIVVVYEDTKLVRGCEVVSRWECVVTAAAQLRA